ncbi:MAG: hypothetical protein AAF560_31430 [Acidobacteriota bacterium]
MTHSKPPNPALEHWTDAERRKHDATPPTPEELVAYRDGTLDDASRQALQRRLALFPEHAREYLDLLHFDELEAPSPSHQVSDDDIAAALSAVRGAVAAEPGATAGEGHEDPQGSQQEPAARSESLQAAPAAPLRTVAPRKAASPAASPSEPASGAPDPFYRVAPLSPGGRLRRFAMAATLVLALGAGLAGVMQQRENSAAKPRYVQVVDLSVTRGGGSTSVARPSKDILLLFHDADLGDFPRGELEVSDHRGQILMTHEVEAPTDATVPLSLTVDRASFPDGSYRIVLYGIDEGGRQLVRDYRWKLASESTE